jgi:hypothetical protein
MSARTNIQKTGEHSDDARESAQKLEAAIGQMTAEEAAGIILRDMARGKKRILVGRDVKILDIVARLLPTTYDRIVARYV